MGQKVGKVTGIDQTTINVERGRFTRLSVLIDLSKPLLSKFRLHGEFGRYNMRVSNSSALGVERYL